MADMIIKKCIIKYLIGTKAEKTILSGSNMRLCTAENQTLPRISAEITRMNFEKTPASPGK